MLGDLDAGVGNEEVLSVMGKYGVPGRNVSGERLLKICCEREMVIGNAYFMKKESFKLIWKRIHNGSWL